MNGDEYQARKAAIIAGERKKAADRFKAAFSQLPLSQLTDEQFQNLCEEADQIVGSALNQTVVLLEAASGPKS